MAREKVSRRNTRASEAIRSPARAGEGGRRTESRQHRLLEIANVLNVNLDPEMLFAKIAEIVNSVVDIDRASLALYEPELDQFQIVALAIQEGTQWGEGRTIPHVGSRLGKVLDSGESYLCTLDENSKYYEDNFLVEEGMHMALVIPLEVGDKRIGTFNVNARQENALGPEDQQFLRNVADQIAIAVANSQTYQKTRVQAESLQLQNVNLRERVDGAETAASLMLHCPSMRQHLERLLSIAQSDATVLIVGETGAGKGVMARALHAWSDHRDRPFLRCDCAALTGASIETELFGGAWCGRGRRPGRFERAAGATVFLDEITEIPRDVQGRLLGVLQDRTIERAGTKNPIHVNFRAIASSNQDLAAAVAAGRLREDLYYRLKVITVTVSPLRERQMDILPLTEHFIGVFARAAGKVPPRLTEESARRLLEYRWPGNVRELEHVIECAMAMHEGDGPLELPEEALQDSTSIPVAAPDTVSGEELIPLSEVEARYIRRVLRATRGRIAGPRGAAKILGLHPSTLRSRMLKLGIQVERR